jgi:hypothetical protein
MKFTNTKVAVKEVGSASVNFAKATGRLVKSIVTVPVAVGKDVSTSVQIARDARQAYKAWLEANATEN